METKMPITNEEQLEVVKKLEEVLYILKHTEVKNKESFKFINKPLDDLLSSLKYLPTDPPFSLLPTEIKTDILGYLCNSGTVMAASVCQDWKTILDPQLTVDCLEYSTTSCLAKLEASEEDLKGDKPTQLTTRTAALIFICVCLFLFFRRKKTMNDIIEIDVGGKIFKTYRSTLLSAPGSLLAKMFDLESGLPPAKLQKNGTYFIEGDPKIFEIILNFLRYKVITETPGVSMASVRVGAIYFGIQEMVNQIDVNIEEQKKKDMDVKKLIELSKNYVFSNLKVIVLERSIQLKLVHILYHDEKLTSLKNSPMLAEVQEILKGYKITLFKVTKIENNSLKTELEFEV